MLFLFLKDEKETTPPPSAVGKGGPGGKKK